MLHEPNEFDSVETRKLPPDPGITKAIGLNHRFETAIADLVDNAIDAKASKILIRFVMIGHLVKRVYTVDNGHGMDGDEIDNAMRLGRQKQDREGTLGYFGMGLKSASFSQASVLTVLSQRSCQVPQGRRMAREYTGTGFDCDSLAEDQVADALAKSWPEVLTDSGTVVRWDDIRTFPVSSDPEVTDRFIESKRGNLQHHLGLMFHKILKKGVTSISIDVLDASTGEVGVPFRVESIDPFAYHRSGEESYPKVLIARIGNLSIPITCHIWPGGSDSPSFKLNGRSVETFQGFFFFRNDRLLSPGGWCGVITEHKSLKLARAAINIEDHLMHFTMSAEKSSVTMTADLVHAIETATASDGTSFRDFLAAAEKVFRESNKRVQSRKKVLPLGKGFARKVRRSISKELEFLENEQPLDIRWKTFANDDFIEVDRDCRALWLNSTFRDAVLHGSKAGANDAPLLKTLLFLLFEDIFKGQHLGAKDKDNIALWQELLTAAAVAESDKFDE